MEVTKQQAAMIKTCLKTIGFDVDSKEEWVKTAGQEEIHYHGLTLMFIVVLFYISLIFLLIFLSH